VASYYAARGMAVAPERILLTAGTSEAYAYLFKLLADPGDNILVPRPSYPLFEFLANLEAVEVRQYPLQFQGGWSIDVAALAAALDARTRAIVVVNPNNPTGSFVKRAELAALADLCRKRELALIADEVFSDYGFQPDRERVPALALHQACLTFSLGGLSKAAGLPQMKLGWIVVSGPAGPRATAMERLEWIADTYLSVSAPIQYAAARLLAAGEHVRRRIGERTAANLARARAALAGSAVGALPVEGGWYLTLQAPRVKSEEEWALELLLRDGVLAQPGYFYDFESEAFLIVSLLTQPEVFADGMERIRRRADRE
jgi:hypothetical protein